MSELQAYWLAYCGVLAIRLHPRNDGQDMAVDVSEAAACARFAAALALEDFRTHAPLAT